MILVIVTFQNTRASTFFSAYPALVGRHVSCICAVKIDTASPDAEGQMNFPRSKRFA